MPITFASGLTAAAKDSKHRRTPSELQLRGGSLLCACGNLHQPCDCLLLLYATPCKSQASGKKFIFTSKYILPDITKTALPKQSRRKSSSGLRLPASTSHLERCSCLAGRGPNSSSLFPPLAAVVAVAPKGRGFSAPFCSKNFLKIQFIGLLFCYTPVRTKRHRREEE